MEKSEKNHKKVQLFLAISIIFCTFVAKNKLVRFYATHW